MPGIHPIIYDDNGNVVPPGAGRAGNICIRNPWPGIFQTIWGDRDRFVRTYYERYCKNPKSKDWRDWPYLTGDAAVEAPTATTASWAASTTSSTWPGTAWAPRRSSPRPGGGGGRRGRGGAGGARDQGQRAGPLRLA